MLSSSQVLSKVMGALDGKNAEPGKILLNLLLPQVIPFNRPLGLKIRRLTLAHSEVEMPFKRSNKNHLGGMHACALATVAEYTAGLLILRRMDPARQRLVMKTLTAEYQKQGRGTVVCAAEWPADAPSGVESFRTSDDAHEIWMESVITAKDGGAELARVKTLWQIKPWSQVRRA